MIFIIGKGHAFLSKVSQTNLTCIKYYGSLLNTRELEMKSSDFVV